MSAAGTSTGAGAGADLEMDEDNVPIKSVYFRSIPKNMRICDLKAELRTIYGPIAEMHLRPHQGGANSHLPVKMRAMYAIVRFNQAATATKAIRESACWSNGESICASAAKAATKRTSSRLQQKQSADAALTTKATETNTSSSSPTSVRKHKQPSRKSGRFQQKPPNAAPRTETKKKPRPTYSDVSRLRQNLNDDCLFHLLDYLPFADILSLCDSSTQLAEFCGDNILPKYALDCKLFVTGGPATLLDRPQVPVAICQRALRHLGPHLKHLSINGRTIDGDSSIMRLVLLHCPHLVSLHLFNVTVRIPVALQKRAKEYGQLKELFLTLCDGDSSVAKFISQLDGLESLSLHDMDFESASHYGRRPGRLVCKHLRKLSVCDSISDYRWYVPTLLASRKTLRELYCDIQDYEDTDIYVKVARGLPDLEGLLFKPNGMQSNFDGLSDMRKLRKIILSCCEAYCDLTWLELLAGGPNCVEHLVLYESHLTESIRDTIVRFGAQLRTLEFHRLTAIGAVRMLKQLPALQELVLVDCKSSVEPIIVAAIETAVDLRRIVVRTPTMDLTDVVNACRTATVAAPTENNANEVAECAATTEAMDAAPAKGGKKLELNICESTILVNEVLLLENKSIIDYTSKKCFRHLSDDSLPNDEYIFNHDAADSDGYGSEYMDDMFDLYNEFGGYDGYDDFDGHDSDVDYMIPSDSDSDLNDDIYMYF